MHVDTQNERLSDERLAEMLAELGADTFSGYSRAKAYKVADFRSLLTELQQRRASDVTGSAEIEHVEGDALSQERREAEAGKADALRETLVGGRIEILLEALEHGASTSLTLSPAVVIQPAFASEAAKAIRNLITAARAAYPPTPASGVRVNVPALIEALKLANDTLLSACIHLEEWPGDDDESQRTKAARIAASADAAATVVRSALGEHP